VSYDLHKASPKGLKKIKELSDKALQNGYNVFYFSASTEEEYLKIKQEYNLQMDLLFCDETTLKTIIRSNPGIITLNKGTVAGKWSWVDADDVEL